MLRTLFVAAIILAGVLYSFKGPFYTLLFYLWLAYFRPESWMWGDWVTPLRVSLIAGVLLVISTLMFPPRRRVGASSQAGLFVVMFLISLVSALNSLAPAWSWFWWVEFGKALLISFFITLHVNDQDRLRTVLVVIGFSLGLEAAKQGWVQFVRNPGASNMNPHPMLGDNNGVAMGMFMLAPIFAALASTAERKWEKILHNFFWIGVVMRGISTYSRGGFLSAAALASVYLIRSPKRLRVMSGVLIVAALLVPVMPDAFWDRMRTITAPTEERDVSAEGRLHMWKVAQVMAAERPFSGIGFNAFTRVYDRYDLSRGAFGEQRAVHSSWFGALAEMGIPGALVLLTAVILALWNTHRVMRAARHDPQVAPLLPYALALQASFIVYIVGGTFINAQYSEMMWHLVGLTIALRNIAFSPVQVAQDASQPSVAAGAWLPQPPVPARRSLV